MTSCVLSGATTGSSAARAKTTSTGATATTTSSAGTSTVGASGSETWSTAAPATTRSRRTTKTGSWATARRGPSAASEPAKTANRPAGSRIEKGEVMRRMILVLIAGALLLALASTVALTAARYGTDGHDVL